MTRRRMRAELEPGTNGAEAASVIDEFGRLGMSHDDAERAHAAERLQGTGRLGPATATEMQVVGMVGRASGIDADVRRDAPFGGYDQTEIRVPLYEAGDVWARTMVRLDEVCEAVRLIRATADHRADGLARVPLPSLASGTHASGLVEAWRGPVWYWAVADGPASLARLKVVDPSFRNWPALEYAVLKNIVPDFPFCNKSFNLSYSASHL